MSLSRNKPCPPDHIVYLSEMLATNAATLHQILHSGCSGIQPFRHGDHWHIGHAAGTKDLCGPSNTPKYPRPRPKDKRPKS